MRAVICLLICVSFAFTVICQTCSGVTPNCNNPIANYHRGWWNGIRYLTEPEVVASNPICGSLFADNTQQCCNDRVYNEINEAFTEARNEALQAIEELRQLEIVFEDLDDYLENATKLIDEDGTLTDAEKKRYKEIIEDMADAFDRFMDSVFGNFAGCLSGLLKYSVGLFCLGCHAEWECFIQDPTTNPILILSIDTCEYFVDDCGDLFESFVVLVNDILEIVKEIPEVNDDLIPIFEDPCKGDCDAFICNNLIQGQESQLNFDFFGGDYDEYYYNYNDNDNYDYDYSTKRSNKRSTTFTSIFEGSNINKKLIGKFDEIFSTAKKLYEVHAKVQQRQTTVASGVKTHKYDQNGYPARKVGEESSLDTDIDSAAFLFSWLNWFY